MNKETKTVLKQTTNGTKALMIEGARRIFIITGYSDGLTRVADKYASEKKELKALKLYLLAHNERKTEPIYNKIAQTISMLISE